MEDLVERYIQEAGFVKDVDYFKEMYAKNIEEKWNIDMSALSNQGKTAKRFDFVIKTGNFNPKIGQNASGYSWKYVIFDEYFHKKLTFYGRIYVKMQIFVNLMSRIPYFIKFYTSFIQHIGLIMSKIQ